MTEENGYERSGQMGADSKQIAQRVLLCEAADGLRSEAVRRGVPRQGSLSPHLAAKFLFIRDFCKKWLGEKNNSCFRSQC